MAIERSRSFADLLRQFRLDAGMTQEELGERAGISPRALRKLESGVSRIPRRDTVILLAQALNLADPERVLLQASVRRPRQETTPLAVALPPSPTPRPTSPGAQPNLEPGAIPLVG